MHGAIYRATGISAVSMPRTAASGRGCRSARDLHGISETRCATRRAWGLCSGSSASLRAIHLLAEISTQKEIAYSRESHE